MSASCLKHPKHLQSLAHIPNRSLLGFPASLHTLGLRFWQCQLDEIDSQNGEGLCSASILLQTNKNQTSNCWICCTIKNLGCWMIFVSYVALIQNIPKVQCKVATPFRQSDCRRLPQLVEEILEARCDAVCSPEYIKPTLGLSEEFVASSCILYVPQQPMLVPGPCKFRIKVLGELVPSSRPTTSCLK